MRIKWIIGWVLTIVGTLGFLYCIYIYPSLTRTTPSLVPGVSMDFYPPGAEFIGKFGGAVWSRGDILVGIFFVCVLVIGIALVRKTR